MVEHSSMKKLFHQFTDTHTHTCTHEFVPNKSSEMPRVQVRCGPHHSAQPRCVQFTRAVTTIGETFSQTKRGTDEEAKVEKSLMPHHNVDLYC